MKRYSLNLLILLLSINIAQVQAQNNTDSIKTDVKTGWNLGFLPALGFDSNLGFMYGGIANIFDYGNGEVYPDYNQNLYLQLSAYTKGSMDAIAYFDSYTLIPNKHFTARLSYNKNQAFPFYGFNGCQTIYNADFEDQEHEDYISEVFYRYDRQLIKGDLLLQDKINNSKFNWLAGLDLAYYDNTTVDIDKLNEDKDDDDLLPDVPTIYDRYIEWELIDEDQADGGFNNNLKAGLVYDTRDRLTNPMKGTWTELIFKYAPSFLSNDDNTGRMSLIHRQYFTIKEDKLSFAYRIWYEAAFGDIPYYAMTCLTASNYYEGFGGSTTLRGMLMNRVVARQTATANLELRWKAYNFNAIGQSFYLGFNPFIDAGTVLQEYGMDLSKVSDEDKELYFKDSGKEWFTTIGMGLKLVMNQNFVISADYGVVQNEEYGNSGMYVTIGYIF